MRSPTDEVEARAREQLRHMGANPDVLDGYVVVVGFATRQVHFSYHRFAEDRG